MRTPSLDEAYNDVLTLKHIIENEMSVGYYSTAKKWNAACLRKAQCGGEHAFYCWAQTLEQAVRECLEQADRFECTADDHGDDDEEPAF
jgi:hypothetical protein